MPVGSRRNDLQVKGTKLFNMCVANNIELDIQWIPRMNWRKADFISRIIDTGSFISYLDDLDSIWVLHTVDCFRNYHNF